MPQITQEARSESLGMEARDLVTGFTGVVTAYCQYLTGCTQVSLTPKMGADGKLPDTLWFDIQRVEIIGDGVSQSVGFSRTGGPQITPGTTNGRR